MTKIKLMLALVLLGGCLALLVGWHEQRKRFAVEAETLREQAAAAVLLREENDRLRQELKVRTDATESNSRELMRLRAQAGAMRALKEENERLRSERKHGSKASEQEQANIDGMERIFGQGAYARNRLAMRWGAALRSYADKHDGHFPQTLQEAVDFLPDGLSVEQKGEVVLAADRYDLLYHGRIQDMTNPPPEATLLIREREPWQKPDGGWAKVYIYGNGAGTTHTEADQHFEVWENLRIARVANP